MASFTLVQLVATGISRRVKADLSIGPLTMHVGPSEIVALVGPSGVGKTTLLTVLGGLQPADTGLILLDALEVSGRQLRDQCVWVSQAANSLPARTVRDNAMLGALADGVSRTSARAIADLALSSMSLESLAERAAKHLSGGELQRLAVARAMCSSRPIVIADEPTGNLDRTRTEAVMSSFRRLAEESSKSVIVATHDPIVAGAADRVVEIGA